MNVRYTQFADRPRTAPLSELVMEIIGTSDGQPGRSASRMFGRLIDVLATKGGLTAPEVCQVINHFSVPAIEFLPQPARSSDTTRTWEVLRADDAVATLDGIDAMVGASVVLTAARALYGESVKVRPKP